MYKNIVITGGSGYLGSHLVKSLVARGGFRPVVLIRKRSNLARLQEVKDQVLFFDIDTNDLSELFLQFTVQTVIHCATNYGRRNESVPDILTDNLVFPLKLIEQCRTHNVPVFINTDTALQPMTNAYALSKKQFRQWLEKYARDMICINLEMDHFYGPRDDSSKFVTMIIRQLLQEIPAINLTKGEQVRQYLYIDDVVQAYIVLLNTLHMAGKGYFNYQLAGNEPISIRNLAMMIREMTGNTHTELMFGTIPYREYDLQHTLLDTSLLQKLGWHSAISLREGLTRTIHSEREKKVP